jgi:hypothetical protein
MRLPLRPGRCPNKPQNRREKSLVRPLLLPRKNVVQYAGTTLVSKSEEMVERTLRLWCWLTTPEVFAFWQKQALAIYK